MFMRHFTFILALAAVSSPVLAAPFTATFEDIAVSPNSYLNGGPTTSVNTFTSGGLSFGNRFTADYGGYWSGFSISNVNNTTTPGFTNQYAAITGTGSGGGGNYAVFYSSSTNFIDLPAGTAPVSVDITNTTYAALSMKNGDSFAKKFGGTTGNDPDYFKLTLTGYTGASGSGSVTSAIDVYLADFRFADNSLDYILSSWLTVDLTSLGQAQSIGLSFETTDVSFGFANTPTYVALDNFTAIPEPASLSLLVLGSAALLRRRK